MRVRILAGLLGALGVLAMVGGVRRPAEDPFRAFHRQHGPSVARHVARRAPARAVDDAIQIELFYADELSIAQIAHLLEATESAVKKRLQRARDEFLERWNALPDEVPK